MSVFNSILDIKTKLKSSIDKQDAQLSVLTNGFADQVSAYDFIQLSTDGDICTTLQDVAFKIETAEGSSALSITKYALDPVTGEEAEPVTVDFADVSVVSSNEYINSLGCSINDIASQIAYGLNTNVLVGSVNDLFLEGTKVATADIYAVIESVPAIEATDVNQFKSMIAQASDSGSITQISWLQVVREICKVGSDSTDNGHIELNSSSPFKLQSFMATVVTVLQITFSAIVTAVGFLLKGVIAIIGFVLGSIVRSISSLAPTTIEIDTDNLGNEYVKGDLGANNINSINDFSDASVVFHADSTNRIKMGCIEAFIWRNSSRDTVLNMQQFMNLSVDLNKLRDNFKALINDGFIHVSSTDYTTYKLYDVDLTLVTEQLILDALNNSEPSVDDCIALHFDTDKLYLNYIYGLAAHSLLWLRKVEYTVSSAIKGISGNTTPMNMKELFIYLGLKLIVWAYEDDDIYSKSFDPDSNMASKFTDWLTQYRENFGAFSITTKATLLTSTLYTTGGSGGIPEVQVGFAGTYYDGINTNWGDIYSIFNFIKYREHRYFLRSGEEWSGLIPKPTVTLPSITSGTLILAVLTTIALVTAACVLAKSLSRRIKAWKQVKAAERQHKLSTLKEQWLADPSNKEAKKAYENAVLSYNKKASLFGWAQYDAQNDWMESSGSSGQNVLSSTSAAFRSSMETVDSELSLSDIYQVITSKSKP